MLADISAERFAPVARRHPDRVINVGIREQAMIGLAAGLALAGLVPVAHSYASFLVERAYEQVKLDLGHQDLPAVLVGLAPGDEATREGRTHQSPADVTLLDGIPGWTVHVPGHPEEVEPLLRSAVSSGTRVYLRLSERANATARPHASRPMDVLRRGDAAVVVAVGPTLDAVLEATAGLDVGVCYARTIRPFDGATLLGVLGRDANVVLVEPALAGTSAAAATAVLSSRPHRLLALGIRQLEPRHYGDPADHDRANGLDAAGIRASLDAFLA